MFGAFISLVLGWIPLYVACSAFYALGSFPMTPVLLELITRKFDNIPLHISNTLLYVISQIFTVIMQQIISAIGKNYPENEPNDSGAITFDIIIFIIVLMLPFIARMDDDVK